MPVEKTPTFRASTREVSSSRGYKSWAMTTAAPLNLALHFAKPFSNDVGSQLLPPAGWRPPRDPMASRRPLRSVQKVDVDDGSEADEASSSSDSQDPWDSGDEAESSSRRNEWVTALGAWDDHLADGTLPSAKHASASAAGESEDAAAALSCVQTPQIKLNVDEPGSEMQVSASGAAVSGAGLRLGGLPGPRLAVGLQDGSVWIFVSNRRLRSSSSSHLSGKTSRPPSIWVPESSGSASPSTPGLGSSLQSRPDSPTPSTQSSRSRRTAASFPGFTTTPTSPTVGTTTPIMPALLSDVDSTSIAGGSTTTPSQQGEVERQLEAQWQAGNKEPSGSVMSSVMGKLGFGHATPPHPHSHAHLTPRQVSSPSTDGPANTLHTLSSTSESSGTTSSLNSRQRSQSRSGPVLAPPHNAKARPETGRVRTPSHPDGHDAPEERMLSPILQLLTPDPSPVVSIVLRRKRRSSVPSSVVALQRGGTLTEWSLSDGRHMGSIFLSLHHHYSQSRDVSVAAPAKATSHQLSIPNPLAQFSSLRSRAGTPDGSSADNKTASSPQGSAQIGTFSTDVSFDSLQEVSNVTLGNNSLSADDGFDSGGGDDGKDTGSDRVPSKGELFLAYDSIRSRACLLSCVGESHEWHLSSAVELPDAAKGKSPVARTSTSSYCVEILYLDMASHLRIVSVPLASLGVSTWGPLEIRPDIPASASPFFAALRGASSGADSPRISVNDDAANIARVAGASAKLASLTKAAADVADSRHTDLGELPLPDNATVQGVQTCGAMIAWWGSKYLSLGRLAAGVLEVTLTTETELPEIIELHSCKHDEEDIVTFLVQCKDSTILATIECAANSRPTVSFSHGGESADAVTLVQGTHPDIPQLIGVSCSSASLSIKHLSQIKNVSWQYRTDVNVEREGPTTTAMLPLSMERICLAASDAGLAVLPLVEVVSAPSLSWLLAKPSTNASRYAGSLSLLQSAINFRTASKHIVGGTKQGDLIFWDASSFKLQAEWALFTSPVASVISFGQADNTLRLHGCLIAISEEGNVAVVLLDGLKLLSLIPNRGRSKASRLSRIAVRADELLLLYDDSRARVWDMRTQDLRRSISFHEAQALISDGNGVWTSYEVTDTARTHSGTSGVLSTIASARDNAASTLLADSRRAIEAAARAVTPPINALGSVRGGLPAEETLFSEPDPTAFKTIGRTAARSARTPSSNAGAKKAANILRPLLLALLPLGLTEAQDVLFAKVLEPISHPRTNVSLGLYSSPGFLTRTLLHSARSAWTVSSLISTDHLLALIGMLNVLAHVEELESIISDCITFLALDLPLEIGPAFQPLSLPRLAEFTLDSNYELQQAAKTLFATTLEGMLQRSIEAICEEWQPLLPSLQLPATREQSPQALSLLGLIAVDRYKMLSPALLKEISSSIALYIHNDDRPMHQAIAIELCCCGFSIWQHYFDAMEVVRSIFALSTSKDANVVSENRALARQATLHIAADNTPLFMTTLSHDILHARSPAHCSATMRLVAFMVRRKPLILYPNLPRLAEAVVKSLDPTVTAMREAVVQAATVMIGELVRAYPTIAFHGKGQRLAVGTHEGAVILYDLKTATRLYVLEGHRRQLSACAFAPDGRRLVTVSMDEGKALIWKVGTSITSMFTPGSMPRQGGTDPSGAYKAIDFNLGDAAPADAAEALEVISMEWQDERNVRLRVGQASMNFSVV